jgi:hypothetical protein
MDFGIVVVAVVPAPAAFAETVAVVIAALGGSAA